jgi:hypothetical protein
MWLPEMCSPVCFSSFMVVLSEGGGAVASPRRGLDGGEEKEAAEEALERELGCRREERVGQRVVEQAFVCEAVGPLES